MLKLTFLLCVAGIGFTWAGYPLLLALWARLRPRPVARAPFEAPVTVLVVAHQAADIVQRKLESVFAQDYPPHLLRVLVAVDGGGDATAEKAAASGDPRVRVLAFPQRRGKAACLNDAVAACEDEFIVFTDVRQPLDRGAVRRLLACLADPDVGAVSGELCFYPDAVRGFGESVDAYWRYEKFVRERESGIDSVVGVTGALYALRRSLWQPIPPQTILDDVMVPMNVVLQGRRVVFEREAIAWDWPSASIEQESRRKVRTLAGNFQLFALRPQLLSPRHNRLLLQTVCHKVLRLLVPAMMAGALLSNLALAVDGPRWRLLLAAHLAAYALAVLGLRSERLRAVRVVRLGASFVQMNLLVVRGFLEFIGNREAHLWRSR